MDQKSNSNGAPHSEAEFTSPDMPISEVHFSAWTPSFLEERRGDWLGFIVPSMLAASALATAIVVLAFAILISVPAAGLFATIAVVVLMRRAATHRLQAAMARKPNARRRR
ncbi:hypothetical protein [Methylocapsa palsarum]|nr:hypothetical protein [Methylocapsa palsarum]